MAIYPVSWNQVFPKDCQGGALSIGNFDGVHRGHQTLLAELQHQARQLKGPAVALTFDPPPSQLLRPGSTPAALTTLAERGALMARFGAEHVLIVSTTLALLQRTAQDFFDRVILHGIVPRTLVPGFNFAFGRGREGTVGKLQAMCRDAGLGFVLVPPLD